MKFVGSWSSEGSSTLGSLGLEVFVYSRTPIDLLVDHFGLLDNEGFSARFSSFSLR